jgi:2-methylcitrate dehydratase
MISNDPSGVLNNGDIDNIESIKITAYEPAFGIIGDIAKRNPKTR